MADVQHGAHEGRRRTRGTLLRHVPQHDRPGGDGTASGYRDPEGPGDRIAETGLPDQYELRDTYPAEHGGRFCRTLRKRARRSRRAAVCRRNQAQLQRPAESGQRHLISVALRCQHDRVQQDGDRLRHALRELLPDGMEYRQPGGQDHRRESIRATACRHR